MKISRSARKTLRTGLRWKKGQSSSSNPGCRRFRDAAALAVKRVQFAPSVVGEGGGGGGGGGGSGVTTAALARHNRRLDGDSASDNDGDEAADEEDEAGSVETWATNFTGCTNRCFDKVLAHWADRQNAAARKSALAVLAAVAQIIRDRGGQETNEEYFQALLTALVSVEPAMRPAAAHLLSVLLRRMDSAAVAPAFAALTRACLQLLHAGAATAEAEENAAGDEGSSLAGLQRSLLLCLGAALAALPKTAWHAAATRQVLQAVLQFTQSVRPKLRKAALGAVSDLLGATQASVPVALTTAFALDLLRQLPSQAASRATGGKSRKRPESGGGGGLAALRLLRGAAPHQTERQARATIETLLAAAAPTADSATFAEAMLTLRAVFWRRHSPQLTGQALTALYEARPALEDAESARVWLDTARAGVGALAPMAEGPDSDELLVDYGILEAHWAKLFGEAFRWLSHAGGSEAARRACRDACHHLMTELAPRFGRPDALAAARSVAMATLQGGLSYQFYAAWPHVARLLGAFFRCHGRDCLAASDGDAGLRRCLALLADLRDAADETDAEVCGCLESALSAALESLGPAAFLAAVPVSDLLGEGQLQRSWLLPMLRRHVRRGAELAAFARHLLPLAARCQAAAAALPAARVLELQVWSTLPAFCSAPSDFAAALPAFARRLGDLLTSRPDLRLHLLAALRRLLSAATEAGAPAQWRDAMSGYARNFAPRLFALHAGDPAASRPHRLAALETVRAYAPLFPPDLLATWFAKAAEKATAGGGAAAGGVEAADLVVAMAGSLRVTGPAVDLCRDWWASGDPAMQKKGYRLAETLLAGARARRRASETVNQFAQLSIDADASIRRLAVLLTEAAAAGPAAPSSRKSRLRCLALCVASCADWLPDDGEAGEAARLRLAELALPEAVLGSRELNSQAREAADSLLLEVFKFYSEHRLRHPASESTDVAVGFLSAVFSAASAAGSPDTLQAALFSVTGLLGHMRHCMGRELLASLLQRLADTVSAPESPRTLVKAALRCLASVVRKFGHVYTLEQVAECLGRLPEPLRPVFRATVRRILTDLLGSGFSLDTLRAGLPAYYHRQLANVRKRTEHKAKRAGSGQRRGSEGEGDGEATSVATRVVRGIDDLLRMSDDEDSTAAAANGEGDATGAAWLQEGEGEILDLRDANAAARIHRTRPAALASKRRDGDSSKKRGRDGDGGGGGGGFKLAPDGRMIIVDEGEGEGEPSKQKRLRKSSLPAPVARGNGDGDDFDSAASSSNGEGEDEGDGAASTSRYQPGGRGIHRDMSQQAQPQKKKAPSSKPAVKKQKSGGSGGLEPYSFLGLDRRLLNRKNLLGKRARLGKYKGLVRKQQQKKKK